MQVYRFGNDYLLQGYNTNTEQNENDKFTIQGKVRFRVV